MPIWRGTLTTLRDAWASLGSARDRIPADIRERLPLTDIQKVTFYKRDELTTDLICCDVEACGRTWFFHEEADGWDDFVRYLEQLPGIRRAWYEAVVPPTFARSETIAFTKG